MITSPLPLIFIIASIIALGVTGNLFTASPYIIAIQVAAVALNVWARISFKRGTFRIVAEPGADSLIRNGPFRFIRHPMYSAVLVFVWTAVVSHLAPMTLAIGVAVTIVGITRVVAEEKLLRAKYPEYMDYSRSTKALIPFVI